MVVYKCPRCGYTSNLRNDLRNNGISESIILRTSNVPDFDFQINNLVKLEKSNNIKNIKSSFIVCCFLLNKSLSNLSLS